MSLFAGHRLIIDEYPVRIKNIGDEVKKFRDAVKFVIKDLKQTKLSTETHYGKELADIFSAQILILKDEVFLEEIDKGIIDQRKNAEYMVYTVFRERQEFFLKQKNEYFKDRAWDIQALKRQIIAKLKGQEESYSLSRLSIVVASDLTPKDTVTFDRRKILGFAVDHGGKTSHTAILARSLEVPCVVGLHNFSTIVEDKDLVIIDGSSGLVYLNPDKETVEEYKEKQRQFDQLESELLLEAGLPVSTKCGQNVEILANLELQDEVSAVLHVGAKGVGLLRTEGLFLESEQLPDEALQTEIYSQIANELSQMPVTIRTLDIGGDKAISQIAFPPEANPFLGWRAIRFSLESTKIFKQQLKAILKASGLHKNIKIMLPFITTVEEIRQTKALLGECKEELRKKRSKFDADIELGIMIETPGAALLSRVLVKEVDFFSIGTNDLTQYTLAVDRGNEKIAKLYSHFHPGVLELIKKVISVADKNKIPVSLCGEMAGDINATIILLGLGLRVFSATPIMIPAISKIIRKTTIKEAERIADKVINMSSSDEVEKYASKYVKKIFGNIIY